VSTTDPQQPPPAAPVIPSIPGIFGDRPLRSAEDLAANGILDDGEAASLTIEQRLPDPPTQEFIGATL
jgi:hypothetical protein